MSCLGILLVLDLEQKSFSLHEDKLGVEGPDLLLGKL
jgi:hypothetical protein